MALPYTLSAIIEGHTSDVRCVSALKMKTEAIAGSPVQGLVSGSRDMSARLWVPEDTTSPESLNRWRQKTLFNGHTNYVSSVATMEPDEQFRNGLIYTGCNDGKIRAYDPYVPEPLQVLEGHEANVSSLFVSSNKTLLSGSWDKTARVWVNGMKVMTLKGHEAAVWCTAILSEPGCMVTGAADNTIKLWKTGSCRQTLKGHTQAVRDVKILTKYQFVSCGNDGKIFVWQIVDDTLEAEVMFRFEDIDFVYSICVLPNPQSTDMMTNYGWVTCGENNGLKVFHNGKVNQEIYLPAVSVWSVSVLNNGDLIAGCSDSRVYVFTSDKARMAPTDLLTLFDAEVEKFKRKDSSKVNGHSNVLPEEVGGVKTSEIPGPESLNMPGRRDGQTKMIRCGNTISVHSWSEATGEWTKIGDVVGEPNKSGDVPAPGSKVMFEGKEYDHVFHIDIDEGVILKLPYNNSEEPYVAAQNFIHKHNLPQDYLDQVAQFIIKNSSGGMRRPNIGTASDPYTGTGAYVSGSGGVVSSNFTNSCDPFTGSSAYATSTNPVPVFFPQTTMLDFSQIPKMEGLCKKLKEFNDLMPTPVQLRDEELQKLTSCHETGSGAPTFAELSQLLMALRWPKLTPFNPMLDVARLALLNKSVGKSILENKTLSDDFADVVISHVADSSKATNQMLALKVLSNMFTLDAGLSLMMRHREAVLQHMSALFPTDNKSTQIGLATLILNYSIAATHCDRAAVDSDAQQQCLTVASLLVDGLTDPEAKFRVLVALGTLFVSGSLDIKSSANSLGIREKVRTVKLSTESTKVGQASEAVLKLLL